MIWLVATAVANVLISADKWFQLSAVGSRTCTRPR